MSDLAFSIMDRLTDVPFNIWRLFWAIGIPVIIFSVGPHKPFRLLAGRWLIALIAIHILINMDWATEMAFEWKAYEDCRANSSQRMDSPEMEEECSQVFQLSDTTIFFILPLAWLMGLIYIAFWEFCWRIWYWTQLREYSLLSPRIMASNLLIFATILLFLNLGPVVSFLNSTFGMWVWGVISYFTH